MKQTIINNSGIYKITCISNEKFYIGSSNKLRNRITEHKRVLRKGTHPNSKLQRAWNKYGEEAFIFEVVEIVDEVSLLLAREQFWMDSTKPFFNILRTAGSQLGYRHTQDARRRISLSLKGRRLGETARKRMSEAAKSRTREHLDKIGEKRSGFYILISPEGVVTEVKNLKKFCIQNDLTLSNMHKVTMGQRIQHKGWKCATNKARKALDWHFNAHLYRVTDPNGVSAEIRSLSEFCRNNGLTQAAMWKCAKGKQKTHKGWSCEEISVQ